MWSNSCSLAGISPARSCRDRWCNFFGLALRSLYPLSVGFNGIVSLSLASVDSSCDGHDIFIQVSSSRKEHPKNKNHNDLGERMMDRGVRCLSVSSAEFEKEKCEILLFCVLPLALVRDDRL